MELKEAKLKYELLVVRHELEEIEMEEQLKALEQRSRDLELKKLEVQLEGLRHLGPDEVVAELEKVEQAFKVSTFTWFSYVSLDLPLGGKMGKSAEGLVKFVT